MRKRQQVIAMLLSLTMTFGLCGSSLTAQTVKAQEAQEVQVGQIQEEVREDTVETGQDKAPEDTAGEVADDMQRPEADVPASDGEAEDAADKTVPEDEKEEEKISDESEGKEQLKGSSGKSETNTFESDDYKRYGSEQTLTAEGLINDVYTYVFWGGIKTAQLSRWKRRQYRHMRMHGFPMSGIRQLMRIILWKMRKNSVKAPRYCVSVKKEIERNTIYVRSAMQTKHNS